MNLSGLPMARLGHTTGADIAEPEALLPGTYLYPQLRQYQML